MDDADDDEYGEDDEDEDDVVVARGESGDGINIKKYIKTPCDPLSIQSC